MITKNLIINQLNKSQQAGNKQIRGLVSFNLGAETTGEIKIFNVSENLLPLSVSLKVGERKFVFREILTPQLYEFKLPMLDPDAPITLLVVANINDKPSGVALAVSPNGDSDYLDLLTELNNSEQNQVIDETPADFVLESGNSAEEKPTCLASVDVVDEDDSSQNASDSVSSTGNFYSLIQPQLDELFAKFPHFFELEKLVANTEWVKVNYYPDDEQHYILGKLYDGETVTHICYGIPADSHSIAPPDNLADYCQWLPLDTNNTDGAGYWVMYQSAVDGSNVLIVD